jgi:hypothetical protein
MKIGAGGLQSMVAQDASRVLDTSRGRPTAEEALLQGEDLAMRRMQYELNRAVERMRQAAELYNQPLEFIVAKDKPKIKANDRRSGTAREFTLAEAEAWLAEIKENKGKNLNGYV